LPRLTPEPPILDREIARLVEHDKTWYGERLPFHEDRVLDGWAVFPVALALPTGSTMRSASVIY